LAEVNSFHILGDLFEYLRAHLYQKMLQLFPYVYNCHKLLVTLGIDSQVKCSVLFVKLFEIAYPPKPFVKGLD